MLGRAKPNCVAYGPALERVFVMVGRTRPKCVGIDPGSEWVPRSTGLSVAQLCRIQPGLVCALGRMHHQADLR